MSLLLCFSANFWDLTCKTNRCVLKEQIFCLPLPEKAKRQHNFIVIPVNGDGVNPVPDSVTAPPEPIVWTFAEATGKDVKEGEDPGPAPIAAVINECLAKEGVGKKVVFPDDKEFASAIVQSHRKGEKAFHVKAFRGSKDGEFAQFPLHLTPHAIYKKSV